MKIISNNKYEFKLGTWSIFGKKQSDDGATVILKRPSAHTHINFESISEAVETVQNHLETYDRKIKADELQNKYLNSEAGAWGRSGT